MAIGCRRTRSKKRDGQFVLKADGAAVTPGPSEKMSKSKRNVIAPEAIIADYGADTIRWFMLSDTPPERDIEWTDAGAEGCWRFVQRVYRLVTEAEGLPPPGTVPTAADTASKELRQAVHKAIAAVTEHLDALRFNSAVAQLYMLANAISDSEKRGRCRRGGRVGAARSAGGVGAAGGADGAASGGKLLAGAGAYRSGGGNALGRNMIRTC